MQVLIYVLPYADNFPHDQIKKINSALCVVLTRTKNNRFQQSFIQVYLAVSRIVFFLTVSREIRPFATVYNGKSLKKNSMPLLNLILLYITTRCRNFIASFGRGWVGWIVLEEDIRVLI